VCSELDKKVIGLYGRGLSVDDVKAEIDELYGVDISPAMISKITDKIMDTAIAWQNRPLDVIYPIVYMDAIHFKVKQEHRIISKAAYICMALDKKGYKDILGIWVGEQEGAKFSLLLSNDLKNRGVKDILVAFMKDMKAVYQATSEQVAVSALDALEDTWGDKYSIVVQSWRNGLHLTKTGL
jgi:putative transposase